MRRCRRADWRVGLTLLATVLAQLGTFAVFCYLPVAFNRITGHNPAVPGALLALAGTRNPAVVSTRISWHY
ncbi:putative MFS family arabinose efflux permease [Paraburkholderia bannensis]|uniref:Putative MFS family arabinose efflux permease n=1 Tax=Paraburkholderia bannensis TaxID=765414 RepID=A0A7W9TZ96_9BURK|nr:MULTISPECIES: hypothetical protein [Paraburkholderia]MBB3259078.1 putative MFS family arabinose efflux permease [Paraburkholderia sp. WP4_3_2]MBB6104093.1 putative MFS family arabinose efflux permease [Paraburkholderia bannensis]